MKRFLIITVCILLVAASAIGVFAEGITGTAFTNLKLEEYADEVEQIKSSLQQEQEEWKTYLGNNPDKVDYDRMYQVYYLEKKDINGQYKKQGSFASNISDKYYWVVPCYDKQCEVQVVRNSNVDNGWYIRQGTKFMKDIGRSYPDVVFGISAIYENILKYYPEPDIDSFRMVYDEVNNIHLMYFTDNGSEYVVPYFSSKGITWISNEKIYPVADYVKLMSENEGKDTGYTNIGDEKQGAEMIYYNYVIIGTLAVICVAAVAVFVAKAKKKKS
ncbi:MAG: hypothetical protein IKT46_09740 [Clostridia bacterium]|nr:hypothetical protein [Clostridia bacterium]